MKKYSKYLIILFVILSAMIISCFIPIKANKLIPIIETQIANDIGVKVHMDKLILRTGPFLKLKTPVIHVLYNDGQKFAQLDNVKFYLPWHSLFNTPKVSSIKIKKLHLRINSDDKLLNDILEKNKNRDIVEAPNVYLDSYKVSYNNKAKKNVYTLEGQDLLLDKIRKYKNFKISTTGTFSIGNIKYISYDLNLQPNFDFSGRYLTSDITNYTEQIKELDFHSDIIADLKIYKNQNDLVQASGFINVDNISVLDYSKKNPKSFVYLTLWGDKASILSNIYTSVNQKIYVEGMLNNSKKASLDLKVKTDDIKLAELHEKLKILSEFSFLKSIGSVNGILTANFTLKGDLNKIKSNGFIKISNASFCADGVKIENINSDIDLSNNKINIKEAIGYVNKAPITAKGYIDKNIDLEFKLDNVALKHLSPSSIGVKSGVINLITNISGTFDSIQHKENVQIEDLKISNKNIDLNLERIELNTNKNNTAYVKNVICKTPETDFIKIPTMKVIIDKNSLKIPNTNIYMPNSMVTINTIFENIATKTFNYSLFAEGFINSKDITRFSNKSLRYPLLFQANGNKNIHNIVSQVLVENTEMFDEPTLINLSAKVDKNNLKFDDLSLYSFTGKLKNDFKLNLKGQRKATISGNIDNILEPNFKNLRIFIPQQLCLHLFDTIIQFKGDIFINNVISNLDIVGQIVINNLSNQAFQLNLTNAILDFNKNILQLNAPFIKINDSSLSASGNVSTKFMNGLNISNLNVKSKYINTDTLLMYKDLPLIKNISLKILDGKFYSEKIMVNLYDSSLHLYAFSSDLSLLENILTLKNISSEIFNGKIGGTVAYNLKDEKFNTNIMARSVSAEPIFNIISTRNENISGTMDFDALLKGELTSKQSLNGNVKFIVNNGRMSSLGKLEHLLYAQNVIADNMLRTSLSVVTKAITLKDTGLFKYLRGDISLENGLANINLLQSQGPLMSLFIKGKFNPVDNNARLVVLGRLSDEIMSGLGAFGDFSLNKLMIMLTGEEVKTPVLPEDYEKIPQLPMKNTKEFRSVINGNIDKPSSVLLFNWISYSQKDLKQKEIPMQNVEIPKFVEDLPY